MASAKSAARQPAVIENGGKSGAGGTAPRVLLSRTTGGQHARNALRSISDNGMLAEFWTTVAWNPQSRWNRLLPRGLQKQLARRSFSEVPADRVRTVPLREAVRLATARTPFQAMLSSGDKPFSLSGMNLNFCAAVARRVSQLRPDIVYAYEGAALEAFLEAKRLGMHTCYDLPSAFWYWERSLFLEEAERNPAFAGLLPKLNDSPADFERMDRELALADLVVVPSQYVRRTLAAVADEKIQVIPYGAPEVKQRAKVNLDPGQPLKVLFAGSLIQRKGISYLLEAFEMLKGQVELTLVGTRYSENSRVDEACRRCQWFETLPNAQVIELMQQSDVLVLPSLSEAFGLVVTEAMACGLPVIVTPNTGASELVQDGREGFIVPICDAHAIAERLLTLHRDRAMLAQMSQRAQVTAAENSWEHYRANLARTVRALACY